MDGSFELPPLDEPLVKLTDFGLSRFIDVNGGGEQLVTRCGSEEYAAPELILGKAYDGRRTDVWALGVVGFALLVGRLPFSGTTRRAMLVKIARGSYQWPEELTTDTDGPRDLVDEMLVREPERRISLADGGVFTKLDWLERARPRWCDGMGSGRRPTEGSEAARFLAGELQNEP